jgi:hypothetical protein
LLTLSFLSAIVGVCLTRYNVFAVLIAIAVVVAGALIYDIVDDAPLTHSLVAGAIGAIFVPVGYLVGQLLRPSPHNRRRGER